MTYEELFAEIMNLSVDDRIRLAQDLWDSLPDDPDLFPLSDEDKAELDRRLEEHRKNPNEGCSWEEVKARLLKGLSDSD